MFTKTVVSVLAVAAFGLVACGNSTPAAKTPTLGDSVTAQTLSYEINAPGVDAKTPDGVQHDNFHATGSTAVKVGVPVTITVRNYDSGDHGMTFATLNLSEVFPGSKVEGQFVETTFTFTPTKSGTLRWYCPFPCDTEQNSWAMSEGSKGPGQEPFMAGVITVS